ncbi:DoxX family protein [Nocardia altamirensis]|uniref:DoxX family protein n=1 Tax=Nocardia altamirensis TaxID=472158 RepID=UPI0008400EB1|nr:DoxX family protein [Nocardia altamirensis]
MSRIVFRFCFVYFGVFCVVFPQFLFVYLGVLGSKLPENAIAWTLEVLEPVFAWVGRQVFGVDAALNLETGSGDQTIIWIFLFCALVIALAVTLVWTVLDRRRPSYQRLHAWFLLFLRLALGGQMFFYGMAKVIPTQMPEPPLMALLTPYGHFTPMAVLWSQVGSSPVYQILLGSAEVLAGALLLLPRTATLGAMLSLVSMAQVFVLNMTFDVPVKILAGHLLLICLILLAPQAGRLANMLVLQRPSEPATQPEPFRSRRVRRIAVAAQLLLVPWVILGLIQADWQYWKESGGAPKPPLYGIWAVSEFTRDGQPVPPLVTDKNRWQRLVFDVSGSMYQQMDGTLVPMVATVDTSAGTLALSEAKHTAHPLAVAQAAEPVGAFTFTQPAPDRLRLDGQLDGHPVTVTLEQIDLRSFPLRGTDFRWVQDEPRFG